MRSFRLSWLMMATVVALAATACVEDDKDDDDDDDIDLGGDGGGSGGGDGGSTGGSTGGGSGGGGGDYGWVGTRELAIEVVFSNGYEYGTLCDIWWDTWGEESSSSCPGCDFTFDVEAEWAGDDMGNCSEIDYFSSFTAGFAPDYYFAGYGTYDVMLYDYGGDWYPFWMASYSGGTLNYYTYWYNYSYGYYYTYYYIYYWDSWADISL